MEQLFYVRRGPSLQYGPRVPQDILDTDQVFALRGERNDERLVRLGFVASVSPNAKLVECGTCGAKFTNEAARLSHGRRRHARSNEEIVADAVRASEAQILRQKQAGAVQDVTATIGEQEDREIARVEARMDEERPLNWDKTEAAVKAGDAPVPEVTTAPARKRPRVRR